MQPQAAAEEEWPYGTPQIGRLLKGQDDRGGTPKADPRGAYLFQSGSAPLLCTLHRGLYTFVAELATSIGKGFSEVDFVWQIR